MLVPNCYWTGHECDVLAVTKSMKLIDVEIKISRSDLKADHDKDKWWNTRHIGYGPVVEHRNHHGTLTHTSREPIREKILKPWPRKVWKHYYCMPEDIWSDDLLAALPSPKSGVLLMWDRGFGLEVKCVRKASPNAEAKAVSPEDVTDIARLAGLRMWESKLRAEAAHRESRRWREQFLALSQKECRWQQDDPFEGGPWLTTCGNAFEIIEGTPANNNMAFCPYCGGKLVEAGSGAGGVKKV